MGTKGAKERLDAWSFALSSLSSLNNELATARSLALLVAVRPLADATTTAGRGRLLRCGLGLVGAAATAPAAREPSPLAHRAGWWHDRGVGDRRREDQRGAAACPECAEVVDQHLQLIGRGDVDLDQERGVARYAVALLHRRFGAKAVEKRVVVPSVD